MSGSNYQQNNKKIWNHATPWVRLLNNSQGVANVPVGRHWHTGNICQGYDGSQYFIIFGGRFLLSDVVLGFSIYF